jgi:hypothetical protein
MAQQDEKLSSRMAEAEVVEESASEEQDVAARSRFGEILRLAFEKARREQQPGGRQQEKRRDRSGSLFLLAAAAIAVLLLFLGVFSSPNSSKKSTEKRRADHPDLGRRDTASQQATGQTGSVTPLLTADPSQAQAPRNQSVTAEEVGRTARPVQPPGRIQRLPVAKPGAKDPGPYALGRIDFSDPALAQAPESNAMREQTTGRPPTSELTGSEDLKKPSLVFVRSAESSSENTGARVAPATPEESRIMRELPAGTRLVARLQSVVSSAVATPVVAVIEYNYERDGEIVVPAGAKALGGLQQADRSGYLAIHFDTLQMPDGITQKIDAAALSLSYAPLRGSVSGKKTGTRFLVRTFTGLGTAASYLMGAGGSNGFNGPLSESSLLRDRMARNIGIAGDQELNSLAFNQNIVVTLPGNTRFYIVLEKSSAPGGAQLRRGNLARQEASNVRLPGVDELRQLIQLRRELSEIDQQSNAQNTPQQLPRQ